MAAAASSSDLNFQQLEEQRNAMRNHERAAREASFQACLLFINKLIKKEDPLGQSGASALLCTFFISYEWEDTSTAEGKTTNGELWSWLSRLREHLKSRGITAYVDLTSKNGQQQCSFMQKGVDDSDYILLIGTPGYRARTANQNTNVAFEFQYILNKIKGSQKRLIPFLFSGDFSTSFPDEAKQYFVRDFTLMPESDDNIKKMWTELVLEQTSIQLIDVIRGKDSNALSKILKDNPAILEYIKNQIHTNPKIYDAIFNKEITVIVDVGENPLDAGHVFIGYIELDGSEIWKGFHAKEKSGLRQLLGPGEIADDSKRLFNHHIRKIIKVTEEGYKKVLEQINTMSGETYALLPMPFTDGNCANFVDKALILAGISNGLNGVFSFDDLNKLHDEGKSLSPIKGHLAWNYILDTPTFEGSEEDEAINLAVKDALAQKATEAKRKAEHETRMIAIKNLIEPILPDNSLFFSFSGSASTTAPNNTNSNNNNNTNSNNNNTQ